jgi:transcriptional regulator with XRE-family HTH domain
VTEKTTFADRLRALREEAGLSQYALARQAGLSKQGLSRLELGEREPTWQTVQLLALALGVSCERFVDPGLKPPEAAPARPRGRPPKAQGRPTDGRKGGEGPAVPKPSKGPLRRTPRGRKVREEQGG